MGIYKIKLYVLTVFLIVLASSCSNDEYMNAIPANCLAVGYACVDNGDGEGLNAKAVMKSALGIDLSDNMGIDLKEKLYFFETNDGLFGLCAKIDDQEDFLKSLRLLMLSEKNKAAIHEFKGFHFAVIKSSWIVGVSDKALLVVGPVVNSQYKTIERRMAQWLDADEEKSIVSCPVYQRLEAINTPLGLVTQIRAIPDQFRLPFSIGLSKDLDASQILLSLSVDVEDLVVDIQGEVFSLNEHINKTIKEAYDSFKPITEKYVNSLDENADVALFLNNNGEKLLQLLRANNTSQLLLTGINTTIDMDNILKCADGDFAIIAKSIHNRQPEIAFGAQLHSTDFLKDVNYWKSSCPPGTRIDEMGKNAFKWNDGSSNYYFGISEDNSFYAGTSEKVNDFGIKNAVHPVDGKIKEKIVGEKLCCYVNIQNLYDVPDMGEYLSSILKPMFGKSTILFYHTK